jgi:hypothetical protein
MDKNKMNRMKEVDKGKQKEIKEVLICIFVEIRPEAWGTPTQ